MLPDDKGYPGRYDLGIYHHFTVAIDTNNIRKVFESVREMGTEFETKNCFFSYWMTHGFSISQKFKAILEIIVGFFEITLVLSNQNFYLRGVEVVIFGLSKNGDFSKKTP